MSWIEDQHKNTVYHYRGDDADETVISGTIDELMDIFDIEVEANPGESFILNGVTYTYAGFEPNKSKIKTQVEFVKNGRKALEIRDGDKVRYISKSKAHYMKTGKVTSQNEKSFDDAVAKKEMEYMIAQEQNYKRAKVMQDAFLKNGGKK